MFIRGSNNNLWTLIWVCSARRMADRVSVPTGPHVSCGWEYVL